MEENSNREIKPSDIYSSVEEIRDELKRRQCDSKLQAAVSDFLKANAPDFLPDQHKQYAFFSRPIITPNIETKYFLDIIKIFDLEPLFLEFPDKFVSRSKEKLFAAKLRSFDRQRPHIRKTKTLIDFQTWEGARLRDVKLLNNDTSLLDHHTELFSRVYPEHAGKKQDITTWFETVRSAYPHYYTGFLALFLTRGVLFENFLLNDPAEQVFFQEKVAPSFLELKSRFGIKPLIFPILPIKDERDTNWLQYHTDDIDSMGI
ncbi:MAG: hypothetical protein RLZZ234_136 [Candidatus Parcubacteria bacterium]|jgi:hypothetical protein